MRRLSKYSHQFCILTFNRPIYLKELLLSIFNQTLIETTVKVFDCSTTKKTKLMLKKHFSFYLKKKQLIYYKFHEKDHFPNFKKIYTSANYKYITYLHDDDVIYPNFYQTVKNNFLRYPNIVACAVNGEFIDKKSKKNMPTKFMRSSFKNVLIKNLNSFYGNYFNFMRLGVCHFSGYTFNLKKTKNIIKKIDFTSNKQTLDVFCLGSLLKKGPILYIGNPLMSVRWHSTSANANQNLSDRFFLLHKIKLLIKNNEIDRKILDDYRFCLYFDFLKLKFKNKNLKKFKIFYLLKNIVNLSVWLRVAYIMYFKIIKNLYKKLI